MSNLWVGLSKIFILTVVIGGILLSIFKAVFPEISPDEVLRVIGLIALGLALLVNYLWMRHRKTGEE